MDKIGQKFTDVRISLTKTDVADIPLYTHPAKTPTLVLDGNRVYPTAKTLTDDAKYNVTVKWDGKTTHHANVSLDTPLHYNEPKTLTDEEIWEVINRTAWVGTEEEIRFKIAEAILRKAQEK
jgi:hypothetical protein